MNRQNARWLAKFLKTTPNLRCPTTLNQPLPVSHSTLTSTQHLKMTRVLCPGGTTFARPLMEILPLVTHSDTIQCPKTLDVKNSFGFPPSQTTQRCHQARGRLQKGSQRTRQLYPQDCEPLAGSIRRKYLGLSSETHSPRTTEYNLSTAARADRDTGIHESMLRGSRW